MVIWVVVRDGILAREIYGVYDNLEKASIGMQYAKSKEIDNYCGFKIKEYLVNEPVDISAENTWWGPDYTAKTIGTLDGDRGRSNGKG